MKKYFIIIIIFFLFVSCSRNDQIKKAPVAKNGILDLRQWDLKKDGPVKLDGEWNFFWKEFVPPGKIIDTGKAVKVIVPDVWTSYRIKNEQLNNDGYATYHLKVLLDPIDTPLAIKFPEAGGAFETYVNGKKINLIGKVGTSFETMKPAFRPEVIDFNDISNELNIVIHLSNFRLRYPGLYYSLEFGQARDVVKIRGDNIKTTIFFIGIFFMMVFYHLGLVLLRPKEKLPLYFALICFFLAVRTSLIGEMPALDIFPEIPLAWIKTVEHITFYLMSASACLFVYNLFPDESNKKIFGSIIITYIILTIITIITPLSFFAYLIVIGQGFLLLAIVSIIYVIVKAMLRKRDGAIVFFLGFFLGFLFVVNDVLYALYLINTAYISSYGLLIVIFSQSYVLSEKFSKAFFRSEKLSLELESKNIELRDLNLNLENKVHERTQELEAANTEMAAINENLQEVSDNLWGEMQLAKKIQTILLPESPEINGYEIFTYMAPAEDVGGDYYDIINCNGYDWLVIGDVSGHGMPAGLIMMMVQTAIHTYIDKHPDDTPMQVLSSVNKTIKKNLEKLSEEKYMTITILSVLKDGKFLYSGLHQDILIYRKETQQVEAVKTEGLWLGLVENLQDFLSNQQLNLNSGDILLLYTDGITEAWLKGTISGQRGMKHEMYGEKLIEVFRDNAGADTLEEISKRILHSLENYDSDDDVTVVILRKI